MIPLRALLLSWVFSFAGIFPLRADIAGRWDTDGKESQVHIAYDDATKTYYGTVVEVAPKPGDDGTIKLDINNPDPARRKDPILGLKLMQGFRKYSDKKFSGGTIYDPKNGKTYQCKLTHPNEHTLKVRGFIGVSLVGRTTVWTRAK